MNDLVELHLAATYRRRVGTSLARIWENVFDWEHLAHLHETSFVSCRLLARGDWGWRVALTVAGRDATEQVIELRADRDQNRYVSTTMEGAGRGTEIRVALSPILTDMTDIVVDFHVPEARPDRLATIGAGYLKAYARLWDEDEAMMQARQRALSRPRAPADAAAAIDLGSEAEVRNALPLCFELGGRRFRLIDLAGELVAHATECPHWLGPLDQAPVIDGAITCPWHGYVFDVKTRKSADRANLRLAPAPVIRIAHGHVQAVKRR